MRVHHMSILAVVIASAMMSQLGKVAHAVSADDGARTTRSVDVRSADGGMDKSTLKDGLHSLELGMEWLASRQNEDGSWSLSRYPAITALCVMAIVLDPRLSPGEPVPEAAERGIAYILECVQPDGGIYVPNEHGSALRQYNTALCLTALAAVRREEYTDIIIAAEQFLTRAQYLGEGVFHGGFGYEGGEERGYADLSNTVLALEAVRSAEQLRGPVDREMMDAVSLNWEAAVQFLSRVQNLPGHNDMEWAQSPSPEDLGGFVYHPMESKSESHEMDLGTSRLRSYGSMTYAGLLSFIYADVSREDPRVVAAVDWIRRHFTLDENPGMGFQGLYYNYHTIAKALAHWGEESFRLDDGRRVNWRRELVNKLASVQRIDPDTGHGFWVNDVGRWWENDPVLATSYALMALDIAMAQVLRSD